VAFLRGNTLYALSGPGSWAKARAVARQFGGDLTAINDSGENSDLQREFSGGFWIGLTDVAQEGRWRWSNEENSAYTNWVTGEPRAGISANHGWMVNDLSYGQWAVRDGDAADLPGLMEIPVIQRQNRAYLLAETESIEDLRALARLLGGQLATISSNDTNEWLKRELPGLVQRRYGVSARAWGRHPLIGLSDPAGDGGWSWEDGSPVAMAPWAAGEPSDGGRNEHYGQLLISGPQAGLWNDSSFNGVGLLEVPLATNQQASGRLDLRGETRVGETLEAKALNLSDGDSVGGTTIQWQRRSNDRRGWQPIKGAQGSLYTLSGDDAASLVRAVVWFRDGKGHDEVIASAATDRIKAADKQASVTLKGAVGISHQLLQLEVSRSGEQQGTIRGTISWPEHGLELLGGSTSVETLPSAVRIELPAAQANIRIPVLGAGENGVGFVQVQLSALNLESSSGLQASWQAPTALVRVLDPTPITAWKQPLAAGPQPLPAGSPKAGGQAYADYVLNYGPSLVERWREEGGVLQQETWGRQHFERLGKQAGRSVDPDGDTMDWGAAVLYEPGLYQQWQTAVRLQPDLSAYAWGREHKAVVAQAARVRIGTGQSNRLQGPLVFGIGGDDVLIGTQFNDLLVGGYGQDVLTGGGLGGEDWMYGGPGRDRFVIDGMGTCWIRDFTPGEDDLALSGGLDRSALKAEPDSTGTGVRLVLSGGRAVAHLAGVAPQDTGF
jgi:hypothetical protein